MFITAAIIAGNYKANVTTYSAEDMIYSKVSELVDYYYGLVRANVLIVIYNTDGESVDTIEYLN